MTLGTVIAKLTEAYNDDGTTSASAADQTHIPYRDSKLTRILQTSLGGNARVAVICTISPDPKHAIESLSTLKFGRRCKMVVTSAKKGTVMDDKALLQKYKAELEALKAQLGAAGGIPRSSTEMTLDEEGDQDPDESYLRELHDKRQEGQKEMEEMQKQKGELRGQIEHLTRLILTSKKVASEEGSPSEEEINGSIIDTPVRLAPRRGPRMSELPHRASPLAGGPIRLAKGPSQLAAVDDRDDFAKDREIAALKREIRDLQGSQRSLERELAQRDSRIKELEDAVRMHQNELEGAEAALTLVREGRDQLQALRNEDQSRIEQLQEDVLRGQDVVRQLEGDLKIARDGADGNTRELLELREETERLKGEVLRQIGRVETGAADAEDARHVLKEAHARELASLAQEMGETHARALAEDAANRRELEEAHAKELSSWAQERRGHEAARKDLEDSHAQELALLKQRHSDDQASLRAEIAERPSTADFSDLQEKLSQAEAEISRLRGDLKKAEESRPLPVPTVEREHSAVSPDKPTTRTSMFAKPQDKADLFSTPNNKPLAQRGGSLREYRKYEPLATSKDLPRTQSTAGSAGGMMEAVVRAEREEIDRLNGVIVSQRTIMSGLEESVMQWKKKLRAQQELIDRLAGDASPRKPSLVMPRSPIPEKYHIDSPEKASRLFRDSQALASPALGFDSSSRLRPEWENSATPYYGAHLYNKAPPALGSNHGSPSKGSSWFSTVAPSPLPINPESPGNSPSRKPRRTLEKEIQLLRSNSRVDATRNKLLDTTPVSPSKLNKNELRSIQAGGNKTSKDWYI